MSAVPTLFEWIGGMPALMRLFGAFYARVLDDPVLGPVFANMSPNHVEHVVQQVVNVDHEHRVSTLSPQARRFYDIGG